MQIRRFCLVLLCTVSALTVSCAKKSSTGASSSSSTTSSSSQWGIAQVGQAVNAVTTDSAGDVIAVGWASSAANSSVSQTGTQDMFVVLYNSLYGSDFAAWAYQLGAKSAVTIANAVAVDSQGYIYVVGTTTGQIGDDLEAVSSQDVFVTKLKSLGTAVQAVWTKQFGDGGGAPSTAWGVAIDSGGNVLVGGETNGILENSPASVPNANDPDYVKGFLIKFDSDGNLLWSNGLGSSSNNTVGVSGGNTKVFGLSTDSSGNSYVVGVKQGDLLGSSAQANMDGFIAKYDSSGTPTWVKSLGTAPPWGTTLNGGTVDSAGNFIAVGFTLDDLDGSGHPLGGYACLVAKYDSEGNQQWIHQLSGASGSAPCQQVTTDASNNIYIIGSTKTGLDGQTLTGTEDMFMATYSAAGTLEGVTQLGVAGATTQGQSIVMDPNHTRLYCSGLSTGELLGYALSGTQEGFIVEYDTSGNLK